MAYGLAFFERNKRTGETPNEIGVGNMTGGLNFPSDLSIEEATTCLDAYIKKIAPKSPFVGHMGKFVEIGQKYNVNPAFSLAIAGQESTFGVAYTTSKFPTNRRNNYCNIRKKGTSGTPFVAEDFLNFEQGMDECTKKIRNNYLNKGYTELNEEFRARYCGGPAEGCNGWLSGVSKFFDQIINTCPTLSDPVDMMGSHGNVVVIDPGHYSGYNKYKSKISGIDNEGDHSWNVANIIVNKLKSKGVNAVLTKNSAQIDKSRPERASVANNLNASLFVSIHSDSGGGSGPTGIIACSHPGIINNNKKVEYTSNFSSCTQTNNAKKSHQLAVEMAQSLDSNFDFSGKPSFMGGDFGVLEPLNMPGIIIEMFFHDNKNDLSIVDGKDEQLANSIANSILKYTGN